jgi:glycosyltransferase involved in cell wall biosynthesis
VVIAARNECELIGQCLGAVKEQVFPLPYEVIVVDNASSDSTAEIARSFGCQLVFEPIVNQVLAKHAGVMSASGDIVAVLNADCVPPSTWLQSIYAALTDPEAPDTISVTCCYRFERLPWWGHLYVLFVRLFVVGSYRLLLKTMPFVIGGNVAFRQPCRENGAVYPITGGIAQTELGLAKRLNKRGRVRYIPSMAVTSSSRRFQGGFIDFFYRYKLKDYFAAYFREELSPVSLTFSKEKG